jgi:acyl-CoA dehydrogenase
VAGDEAGYYRQLTRMCAAFATACEAALLTLGGELKRRESLSARLGDVLSNLYLASAALKRYHDEGRQTADRPLLEWALRDSLFKTQTRLLEVCDNFPNRFTGRVLKVVLFPLGARLRAPGDALLLRAANVILRLGTARERLTAGLFIAGDDTDPLARLEVALEKTTAARPVLADLRSAMRSGQLAAGDPELCLVEAVELGIIDTRAAARVRAAVEARQNVIGVDAFAANYWREDHNSWQRPATRSRQAGPSI